MNFTMTQTEGERRAIFLGQEIPYPEFIKFEDYMYVPCHCMVIIPGCFNGYIKNGPSMRFALTAFAHIC